MNDVNSRIMQIMREKKLNKNSLSKLINVSQPTLKKIEENINLPSFKLLFGIISQFPDISPEWLMTGQGEMYRSEEGIESGISMIPIEIYRDLRKQTDTVLEMLKESQKQVDDLIEMNKDLTNKVPKGNSVHPDNDVGCADVG